MRFGIVTFPGSNSDIDAYQTVVEGIGEDAVMLWHKGHDLAGADVLILPGGFAYGDYLRAGAIARFSPTVSRRFSTSTGNLPNRSPSSTASASLSASEANALMRR